MYVSFVIKSLMEIIIILFHSILKILIGAWAMAIPIRPVFTFFRSYQRKQYGSITKEKINTTFMRNDWLTNEKGACE